MVAIRIEEMTLTLVALVCLAVPALAVLPTAGEKSQCASWVEQAFAPARVGAPAPFAFVYDGKPSSELLPAWEFSESAKELDSTRTQRTQVYSDPKTGLEVRAVLVTYKDFPTAEWTVYLKNTGKADTPMIESIQALDKVFTRLGDGEFLLHHFTGSPCRADDYAPHEAAMTPGARKTITAAGGRSTNSDLSYFNLEMSPNQGVILAIGWPGQWAANFERDAGQGLRVIAGQELTHLKLHPGEQIRTPMIVMQFWKSGDWTRAQNIWRRWMCAHNMSRPGGKLIEPQYGGCHGNMQPFAAEEIAQIDAMLANGIEIDHWIIDAGWYPCSGQWPITGTWEPDKTRFPKGLREVADHVHKHGIDFIVWFEPERVHPDSWLAKNHPEWILGGNKGGVVNLGDPAAWKWVVETIDGLIVSQGIDHYRSDYNIDPLGYWRGNDADDRQGMAENLYVQGFLAFWDELLRRHPNMFIDTCASGGRRNDVETLRRSVPILRSDYPLTDFSIGTAHGQQAQTYGISYWIPYEGTGAPTSDLYTMRSSYCSIYRCGYNGTDPKRNTALLKQVIAEHRQTRPYWLADYYALTPYSLSKDAWIAWQFDSPEKGGGFIQAFRRDDCAESTMRLKLGGLDPRADYVFTNMNDNTTQTLSGRSLRNEGLQVDIAGKPGSALFIYKRVYEN